MSEFRNRVLAGLSDADLRQLQPSLRLVRLNARDVIYNVGDLVTSVYFPESAVLSLVVDLSNGTSVEAAMIGADGVLGAASAIDGKTAVSRAVVQLGGPSYVITASAVESAALASPKLLSTLIGYEQLIFVQAQQSAACMASHSIEARLSRWLLRARDLSGADVLPFTQEFLAEMLGVNRPSVSLAAHALQRAGAIEYSRGKIVIKDADVLRETTCECYEAVRARHAELVKASR